jgi:hypothetical protein
MCAEFLLWTRVDESTGKFSHRRRNFNLIVMKYGVGWIQLEVWSSHKGVAEDASVLGCDAVLLHKFPDVSKDSGAFMFKVKSIKTLDPED